MDCAAVKPKMEALVSGSLPEPERSLAEQHIAICEGCRLELELVRAIGSQEKQPAGTGSKDDWTLDRIFGSEGAARAASAEPAAPAPVEAPAPAPIFGSPKPAPEPEPEPEPAAPQHPALVPDSEDEDPDRPAGRKKVEASWSFEPVDAKPDVKPPEESLFFAAEALTRNRADGRKASNARVVLWSLGGLLGVGLLAFSAWFVLHMNAPAGQGPASRVHAAPPPGGGTVPTAPTTETLPEPAPTDGTIQDEGGEPPNSAVEATPPPSPEPRVSASTTPPPAMPLATRPNPSTAPKATNPKSRPTVSPLASGTEHHDPPAPKRVTTTADSTPVTHSSSAPTEVATDEDEDEGSTAIESPSITPPSASRPSTTTTRGSAIWDSRAPKADPPASSQPSVPSGAPAQPEITTPIERLHLATVAATEHGDLDALRRLRTTWKSFMVKVIGPDRSRAKREYADCLWAIQDATGRHADQRDALAAYRDYLLGAPAGGADSRSVSRLRMLEDAIAERR